MGSFLGVNPITAVILMPTTDHGPRTTDQSKRIVGRAAAALVEDGMRLGLGTGSTTAYALREIGWRIEEEGLRVVGVPTSFAAERLAREHGIPLSTLDDVEALDLALDGADEVTMDADGPVEVCLPVAGQVEPFGDARVRLEPAHQEAYARVTKAEVAYPKILEAYDSVAAWLHALGKRMTMSPREVYFAEWSDLGEGDPACDVAYPFE